MDNAKGVVVSVVEPAEGAKRAVVSVAARDVCRRCADGRGCGAGVFSRGQRECRLEVAIPDGHRVDTGQAVTLAIEERRLFAASLLVYGWPLAGMASGALAAQSFSFGDAGALAGALLGLAAGGVAARRRLGNRECVERLTPRIVDQGRSA